MIELTKRFIVVYDDDKNIIVKSYTNERTIIGKGRHGNEFDTADELNEFIMSKQLTDEKFTTGD